MLKQSKDQTADISHSLRRLCGLKYLFHGILSLGHVSQPAKAVWIEIDEIIKAFVAQLRHSLRRLCGLKFIGFHIYFAGFSGHSLRRLCGLKLANICNISTVRASHSLRRLCGLKCLRLRPVQANTRSQPAKAVWIEIARIELGSIAPYRHSLRRLCGLKFLIQY